VGSYVTDEDRAEFRAATAEPEADETPTPTPEAPPEEEEQPDEGEEEEGTGEPAEEPEVPAAEQSEEGMHTVKIDGQDVQVSTDELVQGYQRLSDYTRKSQMLAVERKRLADAELVMQKLDENPQATLAVLAKHYGVDLVGDDGEPYEYEGPTPEQVQLQELRAWQSAQEQRQRAAAVDAEVERLHREYGEFDDDSLYGFAVENGIANLETALRAMTYSRPPPDRKVEKRKAAAMSGGQGSNGVARPKAPVEAITSFRDAYEAAKREITGT
jgi:hypothetical protein